MFKKTALFLASVLLYTFAPLSSLAQSVVRVESFTPTGSVSSINQIHIQFSDFMFELGTQNVADPVSNNCFAGQKGRWLNPKEWVMDVATLTPSNSSCAFRVREGLKSAKGIPLMGQFEFQFVIDPATISRIYPDGNNQDSKYFESVDPDQNFVIEFNNQITPSEIEARLYFEIEGQKGKIQAKVQDPKKLKDLEKSARLWIQPKNNGRWHLIAPETRFPNQSGLRLSLKDRKEDREIYFITRPAFSTEFTCSRENVNANCSPVSPVELVFNSPVEISWVKKMKLTGGGRAPVLAELSDREGNASSHVDRVTFKGPFKGGSEYLLEIPSSLVDIRGRKLSNSKSFPLRFKTGGLPVLAKFPGSFGVVEADQPLVPVSIRNIEKKLKVKSAKVFQFQPEQNAPSILDWLDRTERQQSYYDEGNENARGMKYKSVLKAYSSAIKGKVQEMLVPLDSGKDQAEVIGVPVKEGDQVKKGLSILELESKIIANELLDRKDPFYVSTAVLVTNLSVHFKWGQKGPSAIWVTELKTGQPVADADITVENCRGDKIASGKTAKDGVLILGALPTRSSPSFSLCGYKYYKGTNAVIFARKGDDMSFTLDTWNQGIEGWRFNLPGGYESDWGDEEDVVAHTVLARNYLKPGQTVHMRHFIRQYHWKGFRLLKNPPSYVVIRHSGSDETWSLPVKFDGLGGATTTWKIPEKANLGTYWIQLANGIQKKNSKGNLKTISTGSFDVEEFRLPTLGVSVRIPDPITPDLDKPSIHIQAAYLSGGPASELPIEARFQRKPVSGHTRTIGDYTFGQDMEVKTGVFEKAEENNYYSEEESGEFGSKDGVLASKLISKTNLDAGGSANLALPKEVLDTGTDGEVQIALQYSDPNGEVHTMVRSTSVFSRNRYLGVHKDQSSYLGKPSGIDFKFMLGDEKGSPVAGEKAYVMLYSKSDFTHRERLVGGFYGYRTTTEVRKEKEVCSGKTDAKGSIPCVFDLPRPGAFVLEVHSKDSRGKELILVHNLTAWGSEDTFGESSETDRMTLVPDKAEYEANESARIIVQSPFKQASALVTVERGGVMKAFVTELKGENPVVEVPLEMEFAPGVIVSVMAIRGRVGDPAPTGLLDLGRPAYKLGLTHLSISKKSHELLIDLKTNKEIYKIREKAEVSIQTKPGAELSLAVVDKALLKLMPNPTWNLLDAMIRVKSHRVETSTMQMNVIGKRHFGKKATPFGGGGGTLLARELLDSLVDWKPRLTADQNGRIKTSFKLNDSISGFVVVAFGNLGLDYFGTAKTEIISTQDLQIITSVPPTLRERDQFPAQFILRNATATSMSITAKLDVDGKPFPSQNLEIPAQSAQVVKWMDQVPMGVARRTYLMTATSKEGASDQLKVTSKVVEVLPSRVIEGYLQQLGSSDSTIPIAFPKEAVMDKGGYRVQVQARLSEIPGSVTRYMQSYPYSCFEQQTSRAITLQDLKMWKEQWKGAKSYYDSNSLLKFFPEMRYGSLDLSAYVLQIAAEMAITTPEFGLTSKWFNPANLERLLGAIRKGMRGEIKISETWWPEYVSTNERIGAGEALSYYEPISTADYQALKAIHDKLSLSHKLSLIRILRNSKESLASSQADLAGFENEVLTHFQFENTRLLLRDPKFWFFGSLGGTPDGLRSRTLVDLIQRDQKDNATKLLRSLIENLKSGYFDTTTGNAWAVVALNRFKQKFERVPVSGNVALNVGATKREVSISEAKPKGEAFLPIQDLGQVKSLSQRFTGQGAPWSFTLVEAALPLTSSVDHGYVISKSVEPVQQKEKSSYTRGDLFRVTLKLEARAPQTWVVLTDPVPTGATILSTEAASGSWIAFEERRMDRMQVFFEYLPSGKTEFTYTVRLNQAGNFEFPPSRVQAMYDPTQYGEAPNESVKIKE
jgi:uncharacterized protein YfaS (alpha-2-macroglobulin family)